MVIAMDAKSIAEDVEELKVLASQASRPAVKSLLNKEIERLQTRVLAEGQGSSTDDSHAAQKPSASSSILPTNKIQTYAWDQSGNFLKLYITLPEAQNASAEHISTDFSLRGVRLLIRNFKGKNHEFEINNLLYEIVPEKSYHKLKSDMVLLMLSKKVADKTWEHVTLQEQKVKEKKNTPKFDQKEDPQVGLMKMMKQMYEEGDDDMKRTINKAWTESRNKQTPEF